MFFPIRCIFWLTIVFTAIFSQDQARRTASVMEMSEAAQSVVAKILGHAEARITEHCTRQPAECLRMAERLSDFARAPAASEPEVSPATPNSATPLPPPRPASAAERMPAEHFPRVEDLRLRTFRPES